MMEIYVNTERFPRWNRPVEVKLAQDTAPIARVFEVDDAGQVVDPTVPFQHDADGLTFLLTGMTPAQTTRRFQVAFGGQAVRSDPLVRLIDGVVDEDQESIQVITPSATWFYHKSGAGFSSLLDADGLDWLGYRPGGGSAGEYRGIPNMGYPEGYCHPGKAVSSSRVVSAGPICARIESMSDDGKMHCRWDVFPSYARLTLLKMRPPYWFLYEGTPGGNPGGQLDERGGYCLRSDGSLTPLSERWNAALPHPAWVAFGAGNVDRALYLVHHDAGDEIDSYWPMEHNMTVFGFGRLDMKKFLTRVPARFTVGFAEDGCFESARRTIDAVAHPLRVTVKH